MPRRYVLSRPKLLSVASRGVGKRFGETLPQGDGRAETGQISNAFNRFVCRLQPALGESQPLGQKPSSDRGSCHLAKPASESPPTDADLLGELIEAVSGLQILDEPVQELGQWIRADGRTRCHSLFTAPWALRNCRLPGGGLGERKALLAELVAGVPSPFASTIRLSDHVVGRARPALRRRRGWDWKGRCCSRPHGI